MSSIAIKTYLEKFKIGTTSIYAVPMDIFKTLDITQWKFNRPPDMTRIADIHNWMGQFNRMDGVLNIAYIPHEGLVCFEGNHRRLALDGLNIMVLMDIIWDVTHEIVTHEFQRLNKSISVPDLYVVENDATLRLEIQEAVSNICKKYPTHISSSGRPIRPNFNRDKLTDELTRLHKELQIPISELMNRLEKLNEKYKDNKDRSKLSVNVQLKCSMSDLWLFAWSSSISNEELV